MAIAILTSSSFTPYGELIPNPDQLTVVLIYGDYCGFCREMKPVFRQVASNLSRYAKFATIQTDSRVGNQQVFNNPNVLTQILGFKMRGVPTIVRFYKGKVWGAQFTGNRDVSTLSKWVMSSFM